MFHVFYVIERVEFKGYNGRHCGIMKDNLQSYLDSIPGKPNKYQVQIAAIRGIGSLLERALGTNFSDTLKYGSEFVPGQGPSFCSF